MIERKIDIPILSADLQVMLVADKRETLSHFQQNVFDPRQ